MTWPSGLTSLLVLGLCLLPGLTLAGFYYQRFPAKVPAVVNSNELLTAYEITRSTVDHEKACASVCSSSASANGCFAAHFMQSSKICVQYSASVAGSMSLQLVSGTSDDVTLDVSPVKSKSFSSPNSPPTWLTSLNATLSGGCSSAILEPLGVAWGPFRFRGDQQITASGFTSPYHPSQARLNGPSAWCLSTPPAGTWLQIKLDKFYWIHYFDFSGGESSNLVYTLSVQYSGDGYFFSDASKLNGATQIFQGGSSTSDWNTIFRGTFAQPLLTKWIRFLPIAWYSTMACMRVELYGCPAVCREPLGIEGYEFSEGAFDSSSNSDDITRPSLSNLNSLYHYWQGDSVAKYGGGWIQVDLGKNFLVTGIVIQPPAQPANSGINQYSIQYCSGDCNEAILKFYADPFGNTVFSGVGNTPNNAYRTQLFSSPFIARKVRLLARSAINQISGRWEILGCREIPYQSGVDLAVGKTASASPSYPSGSSTIMSVSTGKVTDQTQQDPQGLINSCIFVPADPKAQSYVTIDLGSTQTISDVLITSPRIFSSLDPIGLWLLDFATKAQDMSGNGFDGQVGPNISLTTGIYGQKNGAMEFHGNVNSFVLIPNPPALGDNLYYPNNDFSMFAWVMPYYQSMEAIFTFVSSGGGCCGVLLWHNYGYLHVNWKGTVAYNDQQANVINYNAWNFIGMQFSSSTGRIYFYANGASVGSAFVNDTTLKSNTPLILGRPWDGDGRLFRGKMACIQIYKRFLSREEIDDAKACPWMSPTPEFFWPLDATNQANDYFGNGIDGTVGAGVSVVTGHLEIPQSAFKFNGSNSAYVLYSNPSGRINFQGGLSVSFWFDRVGVSSAEMIMAFLDPNDNVTPLFYIQASSGALTIRVTCTNIPSFVATFYQKYYLNLFLYPRMRQAALTYNSQTGRLALYMETETIFKRQLPYGCILPTTGQLRLGSLASSQYYKGSLACFQMFSRELNYREVIQVSRCPLSGLKPVIATTGDPIFFLKDISGNAAMSEYLQPTSTIWGVGPSGVNTHFFTTASVSRMTSNVAMTTIQQFIDSFTLMVWAKFSTINTETHAIVLEATNSYSNVIVGVTSGNQWFAQVLCTSGGTVYSVTGGTVAVNVFYHIALVRDKDNGTLFLYLNGFPIANTTAGPTCTLEATTNYYIMSDPYNSAASTVLGGMACFIGYTQAVPVQNIQLNMAACPGLIELAPSTCDHNVIQRFGVDDTGSSWNATYFYILSIDKNLYWSPTPTDANRYYGFFFPVEMELRMIMTKGQPNADEWVTSFKLMYYSTNALNYVYYASLGGPVKTFLGNFDRETIAYNKLYPSIKTYQFRVYPLTWNNWPSMRLAMKGCEAGTFTCNGNLYVWSRATTTVSNRTANGWTNNYLNLTSYWVYTPMPGEESWQQIAVSTGLAKITKVAVQGGGTNYNAWVTIYRVGYSYDGEKWRMYKTADGFVRFFTGNSDITTIVESILDPPVMLRFIRFYPEAWSNFIAFRVGIYGCLIEEYENTMPNVMVTLGDNAVTNVASALSNPVVAETVVPTPNGDRSPLHLFTSNGPKRGRYLTVMTKGHGQKLDICQVSAFNANNQNMALKQAVIIQKSAFASSADKTSKAATDGNVTQFDVDSAGQMCIVGRSKVVEDIGGFYDSCVVVDALPASPCSGIVTQWEMNMYTVYPSTTYFYWSTWNLGNLSRYDVIMQSLQPFLREKAYIVHNATFGLRVNYNVTVGFYGGAVMYGQTAFGLNPTMLPSTSELRVLTRFYAIPLVTLDNMIDTLGYANWTNSPATETALAKGYVSVPGEDMWIAVDLGVAAQVSMVAVYVPVDRYGNSLENTEVRVGNSIANVLSNPICDAILTTPFDNRNPQRPYYYHCMGSLWGRYVILRRRTLGVLPVAEILVF